MNADTALPKLRKLMSLALNKAASEEEASSAAAHFVKLARSSGITADRLMSTHTVTVERIVYRDVPVAAPPPPPAGPKELRMMFGKYKGMLLTELLEEDPDYCEWILDNVPNLGKRHKEWLLEHLK